jgi:hypothetical protein
MGIHKWDEAGILPENRQGYIFKHLIRVIFSLGGYSEPTFSKGASR